jgi:hypothetical protein
MKRLVEETTDELARSLLEAGIEHRPPPGNKAQVIVAIGAGGALGMFSSNAFAWLSTTAGKVTAVGVAVGVAGAVWVAAPSAREARSGAEGSRAEATAQLQAAAPDELVDGNEAAGNPPAVAEAPAPAFAQNEATSAGAAPNSGDDDSGDDGLGAVQASEAEAAGPARATAASEPRARSSRRERAARKLRARKSSGKEKVVASKSSELRRDGPLPAADAPPAGGALDESAEQAELDREVRLVDDMHSAARRNDREALSRFLERYRASFPDGQLKREVAEFAARLEHPDISVAH